MVKRIAVLLVNHADYARKHLTESYASLLAQSYPADRFTIFIVNNEGTDETQELIQRFAPTARLLHNRRNLGWAGGNNTALRVALREGYDGFVVLNMDMVVDVRWLEELVKAAEARPDAHILQSKILLYGTDRINSLGNQIHFLGYGYCHGYGAHNGNGLRSAEGGFASGAAMLVKREVFERIGLFRDDYFMYYEDLEFCWRARLAGYNVGVAERSVCYHKYEFRKILNMRFYSERNRLTTLLTLERPGTIALTAPCLVLAEAFLTVYFLFKGWGGTRMKLWRHFLSPRTWAKIRARRREIRRLRRRPDAEVMKHFTGAIVFSELRNPLLRGLCNPLMWLYWAIVRRLIVW